MTPICATFSDFRLVKGRKVCQLVCEVPLEQADAALAALGGLPNPHAERWVGIVPLKAQPQGQDNSGSAPSPSLADAADSPAAAPKPKKHWDELKPSQQAGIVCNDHRFDDWLGGPAPEARWDGETIAAAPDFTSAADYVRWYCGVSSRSELDTDPAAAKRWRELFGMFQADTQYGDRR